MHLEVETVRVYVNRLLLGGKGEDDSADLLVGNLSAHG